MRAGVLIGCRAFAANGLATVVGDGRRCRPRTHDPDREHEHEGQHERFHLSSPLRMTSRLWSCSSNGRRMQKREDAFRNSATIFWKVLKRYCVPEFTSSHSRLPEAR